MADLTQAMIENWVSNEATGQFHYTKVLDGLIEPKLYPQVRTILHRLKEKGIAVPVNGKDGWWRPVDRKADEICWWETPEDTGENLKLPIGLNKYCYIPRPSLILVAGKYNAGKTAFCINVVNQNLELWKDNINFFVSEGAEMMGRKMANLNSHIPTPPPFKMYRRTENFADVTEPDALTVIDYLRVNMEQSYAIGNELFHIFNKLKTGIAVVAMQKPPGARKLAFGGAATAFEPSLYIAMDETISFEKIKVPKILDRDPYSLKIQYTIYKGVNFHDIHEVFE